MTDNLKIKIQNHRKEQIQDLLSSLRINAKTVFSLTKETNYLQILNEALTHTSAQHKVNHERLEFLGDAVLRLASTEFIERNYPLMRVGERSSLRSQLVSDQWLSEVGKNIHIERVFIVGPKASQDPSALSTLQAEATEALIGAIYECLNDLESIHSWLTPHWEITTKEFLADPHRQNSKSALQEWSQSHGLEIPKYLNEEISKEHGDPKRFFCKVHLGGDAIAEGWGGSRKEAEKNAARLALKKLGSND